MLVFDGFCFSAVEIAAVFVATVTDQLWFRKSEAQLLVDIK